MSHHETALNRSQGSQSGGAFEQVKSTISNKLNEFAETLENRAGQGGQGVESGQRLGGYGTQVADYLKRSAQYVGDLNAQQIKDDITTQVRRHPGRTLLIATAAGLFLGSLLRRR